uniref:Uncharacterized protein n=1 Tax=Amaranthus palmeri TaxID=107608 RepID=A0A6C0T9Y2_AMAPA|nr:hypothetical protein AP_R.00g000080-v1.0.a3 [Amaranthus palmeri]
MAYLVHDNWYQSRSVRGGRRYDRDIQNLYSDGVLESKTNSIRGPYSAETRQDLQNDFNRVISLMEGLITRINNNIAHQEQMAKQSQANLDQHREQLQQKYLESKKKSDARFDAILQRISKKA